MKMNCSRCEKLVGVTKKVYQKRIEKFGSEDELKTKYLCFECRKK